MTNIVERKVLPEHFTWDSRLPVPNIGSSVTLQGGLVGIVTSYFTMGDKLGLYVVLPDRENDTLLTFGVDLESVDQAPAGVQNPGMPEPAKPEELSQARDLGIAAAINAVIELGDDVVLAIAAALSNRDDLPAPDALPVDILDAAENMGDLITNTVYGYLTTLAWRKFQ